MRIGRAALAVCLVLAARAHAQQEVFFGDEMIVLEDGGMMVMQGGMAPGADGAAARPPTPRLQKLQQLEFDRRPSSIFAAWIKPPPEAPAPPATSGEAASAAPPPAAGHVFARLLAHARRTASGDAPASEGAATGDDSTASDAATDEGATSEDDPSDAPTSDAAGSEEAASEEPPSESAAADPATPPAGAGDAPVETAASDAPDAAPAAEASAADAAAAAAAAAAKAAADQARAAYETKLIEFEAARLQRDVALGEWDAVREYFAGLTEDERRGGYRRLLQSLRTGPQQRPQNVPPQGQQYLEKNRFALGDVVGLAAVAPAELDKENLKVLGEILRQALDQGHQLEPFLAELAPRFDEEGFAPTRRQLARMLVAASRDRALETLLPSAEEAIAENDREALNLLARYSLARYAEEPKISWLEEAWNVTQAALEAGEIEEDVKTEAIQRAVDIAPKLRAELGARWLDESFTSRPDRGMEIVAAIGTSASQALSMKPTIAEVRLQLLELQTTAAEALLRAAPERAAEWSEELGLLALNWMSEAQLTYQLDDSTSSGPRMQRDLYGNYFYYDMGWQMRGNMPEPIRTYKVLDHRPSDAWLAHLALTLRPRFQTMYAQLFLKVSEEAQAFPYIEALAKDLPRSAESLVDEFLRVWAKNHDPNSAQSRTNSYMFMYGFEERANGIPLTRSKQERNLAELGEWVGRLRGLGVEVDEDLLAAAFKAAHSQAEVYRLATIESIFGPLPELDPETLAALAQDMRTNLMTVWRDPAVQERSKTNRGKQDIEAEVLHGYELARETIARALDDHPSSWQLVLAQAALAHDENQYRKELGQDPEYSARRAAAFETFHRAAELYAAGVESLEKDDESTQVYELWFYAALGACDLGRIDHETQLAAAEIPLIRTAIEGLPASCLQRHRDMFANTLYTRMSSAPPAVKLRYVREGLAITGDHELVREAKAVYEYYADLVTEIQLVARIDGSDRVGHGEPFGLAVDLRHTKEIERESGGFGKYLQNQNSMSFGWNYGRPLEDYRDKFEEAAREALGEHFEVLSVTFEDPNVRSHAAEPYGWRVTPYAYMLLTARGPQVDRIPPLRLDLDFLDTTGYAILPVETAALPIDATPELGDERPYTELALAQTLDERQAKSGKLLLEVKATARGLVPPLASLFDLAPEGFDVLATEDHGVSVVQFAEEGEGILAERTWTVELAAKPELPELPKTFAFGTPKVEAVTSEHFRYEDADLASVGPTIDLEHTYGEPARPWRWQAAIAAAIAVALLVLVRVLRRPKRVATARFQLPERLTPFTVIGLLRDIHTRDGLAPDASNALLADIQVLERHYFAEPQREEPDLRRIAEAWLARAR